MTALHTFRAELHARNADEDKLTDDLSGYAPVLSRTGRGWVEVRFTVPATDVRQAFTTGMALLERATGARLLAVEVMPSQEFESRTAHGEPVPDLVSVAEAATVLGITRHAVHQRIRSGALPAQRVGTTWVLQRGLLTGAAGADRAAVGSTPSR